MRFFNSASSDANAPPTLATQNNRLDFIDSLRGLAILMVVLRHYYIDAYTPDFPRWADALRSGYLGVHLFLLVSGFCVAWPYLGSHARHFNKRDFAVRRLSRILPAYYVALGIFLLLAAPMELTEFAWQSVTHVTMTHNLFPTTVLALNGPFWSLALECQLYLLFPLLFFSFKRFGALTTLLVILALQMTFRLPVAWYVGTEYNDLTFVLPWSVVGRMFEFTLGMWAAMLVAQDRHVPRSRSIFQFVPVLCILFLGSALIAKKMLGFVAPLTDLLWSLTFFCLLLSASVPQSWANKLCSFRPLVWLGVISYSVYLVHELFLLPLATYVQQTIQQPLIVLALALPVVSITILCCFAFYKIVEQPAQQFFAHRRKRTMTLVDDGPIADNPAIST